MRNVYKKAALVMVLVTAVALMVASSRLSAEPNSDSILFAIMSLQKLTPYYWAQNRVGSLLPFVAAPIHSIEWNLLVQVWLRCFSAAMTPLFLIFVLKPRQPPILTYSAALVAVFCLMKNEALIPYWLDGSPYGPSLLIFTLGAFALRERWAPLYVRLPVALLLAFVSSWVNIGIVIVLAPILTMLALLKRSWVYAGLLAVALLAYTAERFHSSFYDSTSYDGLSYAPDIQWQGLISAVSRSLNIASFTVLTVVVFFLLWARNKKQFSSFAAVLFACSATVSLTAVTTWFKINEFHPRYLSLPITLIVGAVGIVTLQLLYDALRHLRALFVPVMAAVAIVICAFKVVPQMNPIWVDRDTKRLASAAIERDVHLIVGYYWRVWPAVFEIISRREKADTYGLAPRGNIMLLELREKLNADRRFICVDDPVNCHSLMVYFTGSDRYLGKSLSESMIPVHVSYEPYFIVYVLR